MIEIVDRAIDVPRVLNSVRSEAAGGVVHFLGTIRNDGGISGLFYESYPEMALKALKRIAEEAQKRSPVDRVSIVHRVGWIPVGEEAVVIAVPSAHREGAFAACRFIIEEIKKDLPVWKQERTGMERRGDESQVA